MLWPCHREDGLRPNQAKLYFTDPVYARLAPGAGFDFTRLAQQLGMALLRASVPAPAPIRWQTDAPGVDPHPGHSLRAGTHSTSFSPLIAPM